MTTSVSVTELETTIQPASVGDTVEVHPEARVDWDGERIMAVGPESGQREYVVTKQLRDDKARVELPDGSNVVNIRETNGSLEVVALIPTEAYE
jgi:hypothetical protein